MASILLAKQLLRFKNLKEGREFVISTLLNTLLWRNISSQFLTWITDFGWISLTLNTRTDILGKFLIFLVPLGFLNPSPILLSFLKIIYKLSFVTPLSVDLWKDPYLLDIPVSFKPTFLNMDCLLENISFFDLIIGNSFSQISLENIFGFSLNWDWIDRIKIDPLCSNLWVWGPQNNLTSITS